MLACSQAWERLHPDVLIEWVFRSLRDFGDQPLELVARGYDLLVIDHPFCGTAEQTGCVLPVDSLADSAELKPVACGSIGRSFDSYTFHGHQWAVPTDAACQVAAVRDDLLGPAATPTTWDEVMALARERPGKVGLPLAPPHAISSFLTLCANQDMASIAGSSLVEKEVGIRSLHTLTELHRLGPEEALSWEPPDALKQLTSTDDLVYVPLTYGYLTYSNAAIDGRRCRFLDIPSFGSGPVGSMLGGAGIAISSGCIDRAAAVQFALWVAGPETQRKIVAPSGGQPSGRTCWTDPVLDTQAGGFFSGTIATMEASWVRPRDAWWPAFQLAGGSAIVESLRLNQAPQAAFATLEQLYEKHRGADQ